MKNRILLLIVLSFVVSVDETFAQISNNIEKGDSVMVGLIDNSKLIGIYQGIRNDNVSIDLGLAGRVRIEKTNIAFIRKLEEGDVKEVLIDHQKEGVNPLYSKYYVTETALGLAKGESYYQNILIGGHIFSHGITDNFSITGGAEVFSLVVGEAPSAYINAKINTSYSGNINIATGVIVGEVLAEETFGAVYGVVTIGDKNNNFSAGLSYGFGIDGEEELFYQMGFMTRLGNNFLLVGDAILVNNNFIATPTIRWISNQFALDLGLLIPDDGYAFPVGAAAIRF